MIDPTKMEFVEVPAENSPMLLVKGRLQILAETTIDRTEQIPIEIVKDRMREDVWRYAYRDLIDPLMRIQRLAKIYVPAEHRDELSVNCDKINSLLARLKS